MDNPRTRIARNATSPTLSSSDSGMDVSTTLAGLLHAIAREDRNAFAQLYRMTSPKLFGIVLRMVRRKDIAEDILQDIYVHIWARGGTFDAGTGTAMAWLGTMARNRALDELRRNALRAAHADIDGALAEAISEEPSPLAELEQNEDFGRLIECLGKLEPERREAVILASRGRCI